MVQPSSRRWRCKGIEPQRYDHSAEKARMQRIGCEGSAEVAERANLDVPERKNHPGFAKTILTLLKNPASFVLRKPS